MRFLRPSNPMHIKGPAKVLGLYLLFSAAWIISTDALTHHFVQGWTGFHTYKGLLYVAISSAILFWLCRGLVLDATQLERIVAQLFRQGEFGVFIGSETGEIVDCNDAFAEMLGFRAEELIGKGLRDLTMAAEPDDPLDSWQKTFSEQAGYVKQRRYVHRSGHAVWVRVAVSQVNVPEAKAKFAIGLTQDISAEVEAFNAVQRQRTELTNMLEAVRKSESRFRQLLEASQTGIVVAKSSGAILHANSVFLDMLGYSPEDVEKGRLRWDVLTPTYLRQHDQEMIATLRERHLYHGHEKQYIAKNGTLIPVLISCGVLSSDPNGEMEVVVSITDMRGLKKKEEELLRLARAVECAFEGIVITDAEQRIVYANEAFERMSGYTKSEVIGKTPSILRSGKTTTEEYRALWQTLNRGESWKGRFWNLKKDGGEYLEDTTITPVKDHDGQLINYLAVKRDITREHALEKRLIQSQKLEAVGQLAGGVAHDLNNVLQVVHSSAELAMRRKSDCAYTEKKLLDIVTSSKRGAGIIKQLLMFSRGETQSPKVVELNQVIRETGTMLKRLLPENIEIITEFESLLTLVEADPVRLSQVVLNLAVNARDAMPGGGVLTIGTRRLRDQQQAFVRLTVSDTGMGIDPGTQKKIFEPFFTTKEPGKGTGLGLATVREVAEQCRARVHVESELGRGTSFYIDFPAAEEPSAAAEASKSAAEPNDLRIKGSVLVCEDDASVRSTICEYLEGAGLQVIRCSNANEARKAMKTQRPEILITDLIMPGQSGFELGKELTRSCNGLKVLLITGHTDHELLREAREDKQFTLLHKPFSSASLLAMLKNI